MQRMRSISGPPGQVRAAGVDVVDVARLGLALRRIGPALEHRICTPAELAGLDPEPRARLRDLAVVFGIKESVLKAVGGIPRGGRFVDIDTTGPGDVIELTGATGARAAELGVHLVGGASAGPDAPDGTVVAWALGAAS